MQPHEVSGTIISLLRELLTDVYADVRFTALQQVLPVGESQHQQSLSPLHNSDRQALASLVSLQGMKYLAA